MSVEEGNSLISDFMEEVIKPNFDNYQLNSFYHTSWAWLMPVVEKICKIDNEADVDLSVAIQNAELEIINNTSILCHMREVYNRVINFIVWYNSTLTNKQSKK